MTDLDFYVAVLEDRELLELWEEYNRDIETHNMAVNSQHERALDAWRKPYREQTRQYESRSTLYRLFVSPPGCGRYSPPMSPAPLYPRHRLKAPSVEGFMLWRIEKYVKELAVA